MNRTNLVTAIVLSFAVPAARGQDPGTAGAKAAQADPIDDIVAAMRAAEQRGRSFRLELATVGRLPGGLAVSTKGVLHVLRGTHPAIHSVVEYRFADGLGGRVESAQTASGIVIFEDDPAFGELLLHVDPATVADLEWAGAVLDRSDLPGMSDRRAASPLGSAMVDELRRQFALTPDGRKARNGDAGVWLSGPRRAGLDDQDVDLPLADRVELFVRDADRALLEVRQLQGDAVLQHVVVARIDVDVDMPATAFAVDGRGLRAREVQQHLPMWEQIEQVLQKAEAKTAQQAGGAQVRPSRRK